MTRGVVAVLVVALVGIARPVAAQDRERVVGTYALRPDQPLSLQSPVAVRVVVRGTLTCQLDASELDAMEVTDATSIVASVRPVVFPDGTHLIERRGPHAYLLEIPPGPDMTVRLNVEGLAARRLVTTSELRDGLVGAIEVDVLGPPPALAPVAAAVAEPRVAALLPPFALGGGSLGLAMIGLAFVLARRHRESTADALARRARQARAAITREARVLGPAFAGALVGTAELERVASGQRDHVQALERAVTRTSWVRGETASVERDGLVARRDEALARLATVVACLEECVVRMAACVADRSAIAGVERELSRVRGEVEIGETVERELVSL